MVEQAVQLGDVRLNLFDTAGLRQTEDEIEAEGIRRSELSEKVRDLQHLQAGVVD